MILVQAIVPDIPTNVTKTEVIIATVLIITTIVVIDKIFPRKRK